MVIRAALAPTLIGAIPGSPAGNADGHGRTGETEAVVVVAVVARIVVAVGGTQPVTVVVPRTPALHAPAAVRPNPDEMIHR